MNPHDPEQNPSLDEIESMAAVAAGFWLKEAAEALDETFGPGYAEKHAPAVAGFLAACATYYRAERSVDAAETVRRALAGVETAIRDAGRGPRATP